MSEQPWTASGRALLQALKSRWRTHILAIEAEAGATAAVPLDYPTLTAAIRRLYTRGNYLGHRAEDDAQAILQEVARLSADEEDPDPTGILDSEPGSF